MRVIGDVHGKISKYQEIIVNAKESVQVGDFGAGFVQLPDMLEKDRFIRGNHDDPQICINHPNWIADGHTENGMMFVGGAYSVDQSQRKIGIDWWENEECDWTALDAFVSQYIQYQPKIMITHDCPNAFRLRFFKYLKGGSRTSAALDAMFDAHKPELWVFGHYHTHVDEILEGVRFVCLHELQYMDI